MKMLQPQQRRSRAKHDPPGHDLETRPIHPLDTMRTISPYNYNSNNKNSNNSNIKHDLSQLHCPQKTWAAKLGQLAAAATILTASWTTLPTSAPAMAPSIASSTIAVSTTATANPPAPVFQKKPDLYVMAMTYQPEFCFLHPDYKGCQLPPNEYWKNHLTIHGLWPEYSDGSYPATCSAEKLDDTTIQPLQAQLDLFWPNQKEPNTSNPKHTAFWRYEWNKHGTCSGLSQKDYLESALLSQTPIVLDYGKRVTKQQLQANGGAVPICVGGRYLEEVRTCLGVGPDGKPSSRVPCPAKVLQSGNCGDEIILSKFPAPQAGGSPK